MPGSSLGSTPPGAGPYDFRVSGITTLVSSKYLKNQHLTLDKREHSGHNENKYRSLIGGETGAPSRGAPVIDRTRRDQEYSSPLHGSLQPPKPLRLGVCTMHDILIALVFVGMVTYPAVVAALPADDAEDESTVGLLPALTPVAETCAVCDEAASLASR